jgi:hypothetical protein
VKTKKNIDSFDFSEESTRLQSVPLQSTYTEIPNVFFTLYQGDDISWSTKGITNATMILLHVGFPWWHDLCTLMAFP